LRDFGRSELSLERDGEAARERWTGEWMPAEDAYVEAQDPVGVADVVVDGSA
jgi:hypothetical protein